MNKQRIFERIFVRYGEERKLRLFFFSFTLDTFGLLLYNRNKYFLH